MENTEKNGDNEKKESKKELSNAKEYIQTSEESSFEMDADNEKKEATDYTERIKIVEDKLKEQEKELIQVKQLVSQERKSKDALQKIIYYNADATMNEALNEENDKLKEDLNHERRKSANLMKEIDRLRLSKDEEIEELKQRLQTLLPPKDEEKVSGN